jgi:hypothetical protein
MPLKKSGPNYADQTGTSETITIQPVPPETSTQVFFVTANYGAETDPPPGVAGTSLTFNVLQGFNTLVFGLASAAAQLQSVNIMQGVTLLSTVSVQFHSGTGSLRIMGTTAPVAAGGQHK